MKLFEPGVITVAAPQPRTGPSAVEKGLETGSRLVFGGFWTLIAAGATITAVSTFSANPGGGFLALLIGGLAGLYAIYIFRGGRHRIMFC